MTHHAPNKTYYPPTTPAKAATATVGGVITTLATVIQTFAPFLPEPWTPAISGVLSLLTALAVYFVPNSPKQ